MASLILISDLAASTASQRRGYRRDMGPNQDIEILEERRWPRKIKFLGLPFKTTKSKLNIGGRRKDCLVVTYHGVRVDGEEYKVGDAVVFQAGQHAPSSQIKGVIRRLQSVRPVDSSSTAKNSAHIQRLRESVVGAEGELFLDDCQCEDVRLCDLVSRLACMHVNGRNQPLGIASFYRFVYEESDSGWRSPRLDVECDSCASKTLRKARQTVSLLRGGVCWLGLPIHAGDLVYIDEEIAGKAWMVGQVVRLPALLRAFGNAKENELAVKMLERVSNADPRYLVTGEEGTKLVAFARITGKAIVVSSSDDLSDEKGAFVCDDPDILEHRCETCLLAWRSRRRDEYAMLSQGKMPAMDLYSGGGGSVLGATGLLDIRACVEVDRVCCETLRQNKAANARMKVFPMKVEDFLLQARTNPRSAELGVPIPGSSFCLTACPPCQNHSGANMHRKAEDEGAMQVYTALEAVEHFHPPIFLLENVPGMKQDRSDISEADDMDERETRNFAREAVRRLLGMNYQCRVALLDCRAYGSPQNRLRLFILAARQGVQLPHFPQPTHANPRVQASVFSVEDEPHPGFYVGNGAPGSGPLAAVTAQEAISDLPEFELEHPAVRARHGIETFRSVGISGAVGYLQPVPYASGPQSEYQRQKRGEARMLKGHYTPSRTLRELDIIYSATEYAGRKGSEPGTRRMTDPRGGFFTLLTESATGGKYTGPIHWNQRRTFTVAERKRIQGVPDSYDLHGTVAEQDRQLGNMVNVDIAHALYGQMVEEVVFPWWIASGKPIDAVRRWRADHPI